MPAAPTGRRRGSHRFFRAPGTPRSSADSLLGRRPAPGGRHPRLAVSLQYPIGRNPYYGLMPISDEKYVASTTYRKSGVAVATQTWICALDGSRVGFWTSSASGKYKRLRNNPSITLQAADARGRVKPGSRSVKGTVELVTSG